MILGLLAAALPVSRTAWAAPLRLLVLGDSLAAGYGLPRSDGFQARLLAALRARGRDIVLIDGAVSGDTTAGGDRTGTVQFVHLTGSYDLLRERIQGRAGHFMKPEMLDSQLAALEPLGDDEPGFAVDITPRPDQIVEEALRLLGEPATGSSPESSTEHEDH